LIYHQQSSKTNIAVTFSVVNWHLLPLLKTTNGGAEH